MYVLGGGAHCQIWVYLINLYTFYEPGNLSIQKKDFLCFSQWSSLTAFIKMAICNIKKQVQGHKECELWLKSSICDKLLVVKTNMGTFGIIANTFV